MTQMNAGRLRPMHPLLALVSLAGPVLFFSMARPVLERETPIALPSAEEAVKEIALNWLRGMRSER
jgi:hypothetical protein